MSDRQIKNRPSTLENALCFLDLFSFDEPELSATDIAGRLGVANSTVHRLASTLMSEGFITKDPRTNLYRLGTSILGLTNVVTIQSKFHSVSKPILETLVRQGKETAHIAILKDMEVFFLNKIEGLHPVQLLLQLGKPNPAHCTAIGQVLLAHQPPNVLEKLKDRQFEQYTSNTITNPDALLKLLKVIKKQGYAFSKDERYDGVSAIAAPIRNYKGKIIAAISITGRTNRICATSQNLVELVKIAADEISNRMR